MTTSSVNELSIEAFVRAAWKHRARWTDPSPELFAAVRLALEDDPEAPTDAPTVDGLARTVLEHLPADVAYLFGGDLDPHALDLRLLDWLEARGLGERADKLRAKVADRHAEVEQPELFAPVLRINMDSGDGTSSGRWDPVRWKWWLPSGEGPALALAYLATGRWHEGRRAREEHERRISPALPMPYHETLGAMARRGGRRGELALVVGPGGEPPRVPLLPADLLRMTEGDSLFGTALFHRFLRWLVLEQWARMGKPDDHVVVYGGWTEIARQIGVTPDKARPLRDIALAMHVRVMEFRGIGRSRGSIAMLPELYERPEAPGQQARVSFGIGPTWSRPGSVLQFQRPEDRRLVPVTAPPSVAGVNPQYHGQAIRLDWLAWERLRDNASALLGPGRAIDMRWRELAELAELPWSVAEPLIRSWCTGPEARWRELADGHAPRETPQTRLALRFLRDSAEREEQGRVNGIKAAAKRKADGKAKAPRERRKSINFRPKTPKDTE